VKNFIAALIATFMIATFLAGLYGFIHFPEITRRIAIVALFGFLWFTLFMLARTLIERP
jgi:hypothetical protein